MDHRCVTGSGWHGGDCEPKAITGQALIDATYFELSPSVFDHRT